MMDLPPDVPPPEIPEEALRETDKKISEIIRQAKEAADAATECNECGFKAKSPRGLKIHRGKAHK